MNSTDYISNNSKALDKNTLVSDVHSYINSFPFSHFPIVDEGKLIGMLSKEDILYTDKDIQINDLKHLYEHYQASTSTHCIDLLALFAQHDANILCVVGEDYEYLGYYELDIVLHNFYNSPLFQQNSTTLLVEKDKSTYSFSEIAQIIESNNVKLLGIYISDSSDINYQITVRVDAEDVNEVIQSLRRYDYRVLSDTKDDLLIEQLKDRSNYLQKYLDI